MGVGWTVEVDKLVGELSGLRLSVGCQKGVFGISLADVEHINNQIRVDLGIITIKRK